MRMKIIKTSTYTNNDETRILVRNLMEDKPDKYKVEYIHAALSLEKKLVVMRAVNYVLDDIDAFKVFLTNGDVEIHNISIERCFRHIAMGRRNWGQGWQPWGCREFSFHVFFV